MQLLDQMDYIDLNSSYLTQTQVAAVKRCALSAGSKTPSLDGSTHEDSTIKNCIENILRKKKYNGETASFDEKMKMKSYLLRKGFRTDYVNDCILNNYLT